ncbi:MAG: glycerol-3-phosphate acyltransferase [Anaerolineales bacterium]|nr:glycerol-3-phosphate acyltransferase [Anaerolineales bacterium]
MNLFALGLAVVIGYLFGAIPSGKIYVKLFTGQDLQQVGSGRVSGTNSMRAAGWKVGVLTALTDVFKGLVALWLITAVSTPLVSADFLPWVQATAGVLVVIGHNWSIFLGFGGGAGTTPNVGWATLIWWPIFPIGFLVMFVTVTFIGYASVGSTLMAIALPVSFGWLYFSGSPLVESTPAYFIASLITAGLIMFSLRENYVRLAQGNERVVGLRAKRQTQETESANPRSQA